MFIIKTNNISRKQTQNLLFFCNCSFQLKDSNNFLHPGEHKVLTDILEIANLYRSVQQFILNYNTIHNRPNRENLGERDARGDGDVFDGKKLRTTTFYST